MAEWKALGYVPDSDDEDDTQNLSRSEEHVSDEGFLNIDDIGKDGEANHEAGKQNDLPEDTGSNEHEKGLELACGIGESETKITTCTDPSISKQSGRFVAVEIRNERLSDLYPRVLQAEDIDELQQDHYHSLPAPDLNTSTASDTECEHGILRRSTSSLKLGTSMESFSSSPLTELPSSPTPPPFLMNDANTASRHVNDFADPSVTNIRDPSKLNSMNNPEWAFKFRNAHVQNDGNGASRNLRQRNPIQLHPYALESEKYRQILKARGIKPLRIAQMRDDLTNAVSGDSQEEDFGEEESSQPWNNDDESQNPASSSPVYDCDEPILPVALDANLFQAEEEFPDVGALLRSHPSATAIGGAKRRKVAHTYSKKPTHNLTSGIKENFGELGVSHSATSENIFDIPPSPPRSGDSTPPEYSRCTQSGFRIPRGLSPVTLPTPFTSSEPRRRSVTTQGEMVAENIDLVILSNHESSDSDGQALVDSDRLSSEDDTERQLERVQRKIRGVLPASWLKIDLKQQKKKKPDADIRTRLSLSPGNLGEHRGVARHVNAPRKKTLNHSMDEDFPIIVSDDADLDPSPEDSTRPMSPVNPRNPHEFVEHFDDHHIFLTTGQVEALEDNRIDEMLNIKKPRNAYSRKRRKLQTILSSGESKKVRFTDLKFSNPDQINPPKQQRITDRFGKAYRKKTVYHPPKLGILDTYTHDECTVIPPYLKIASRTARSRVDKGRHSPSRKYIRLATAKDTNDAYETLKNWRERTPVPAISLPQSSTKPSYRQPLQPGSGNNQPLLKTATASKAVRKSPASSLFIGPSRVKSRQNMQQDIQSSLDRVNERRISNLVYYDDGNRKISPPIRQKHGALRRGHVSTSLQSTRESRPATLESLRDVNNRSNLQVAFQRHLIRGFNDKSQPATPSILLQRFFEEDVKRASKGKVSNLTPENDQRLDFTNMSGRNVTAKRNNRKRHPRRVNVDAPEFRMRSPSIHIDISTENQGFITRKEIPTITNLRPFGSSYTQNFDIKPLPAGTYLHSSTFVGSGVFSKSLKLDKSNSMETSKGIATIRLAGEVFRWGPWDDIVSSQIGTVFTAITESILSLSSRVGNLGYQQTVSQINVIDYFSHHLSFHDVVDRNLCLERCKGLITRLLENIDDQLETPQESDKDFKLQLLTQLLSLTNQLYQVSQHELVQPSLKAQILSLMLVIAQRNLVLALSGGFQSLQRCLNNLGHLEACEYGIKEDVGSIEAIIVSHHIFRESTETLAAFWDLAMSSIMGKETSTTTDVRNLDRSWEKLFTILPFLEFDVQGIIKPGQRFAASNDNWPLVKGLVSQVLETYIQNPRGQGPTFNAYCRALLGRCLHLISTWGWKRSQLIIGTLFDFFARNNLAHLKNEDSHGSPRFLEHLDNPSQLEVSLEDRSFHLFLKILGTGLLQMRSIYPEKKIRDIVWRLMPNHGRSHPKEEKIHQKDLDALRNHHDLLCTLYWASPVAARPRLSVIRTLVHLEASHREACHINIRAWSNLIRFQLSTDEDMSHLEPFAIWHDDVLSQLIRQYKYARSEAEEHVRSVESTGIHISQDVLESNISRNQRQIAASLGDALTSLNVAIDATRNLQQANILITPTLVSVFDLFDARRPQAHSNIMQALDVMLGYVRLSISVEFEQGNGSANDDSQDYGDWSAFEDIDVSAANKQSHHAPDPAVMQPHTNIHEPLKKLLSNCFGADTIPEDCLLVKVIQAWVGVAQILVHRGDRSWDDYVTQFGQDSWSSLRQTEQTRKFTTYYLTLLLENEQGIFEEHQNLFLSYWIESLVERESLVKFQHQLTTAMLNLGSSHAILQNLPFWSEPAKGRFKVTRTEFSERRLSLIACILSNMRESSEYASSNSSSVLKQEYASILKAFMTAIRRNYEELGHDSNSKDAYVGFIHRVVEFLQQYTSEIYPVDRFFTDSAAFPLPTTDPTYVVGRLKNYGLGLQDSRTAKQLSVFFQSVSERAVVDKQQEYLAGQLYAAMSNAFEHGDKKMPTLRSFLVKAILPAYIQVAFSTSSGWLLALPFLMALNPVFRGLLTCLDGVDSASVDGVLTMLTAFLQSARTSLELLVNHSGLLEQLNILESLLAIYSAMTALLPVLNYIAQLYAPIRPAIQCIKFFKAFAVFASAVLQKNDDHDVRSLELDDYVVTDPNDNPYAEIQAFTLRELQDSLSRNWTCCDGRYYLSRGSSAPREVVVSDLWSFSYGEAKRGLLSAISDFFTRLEVMPSLAEDGNVSRHSSARRSGMEHLVF